MFRIADGKLTAEEFIANQTAVAVGGGRSFEERRYFCVDDELFHHDGKTYAFTSQWGRHTIRAIDNLIAAFPDVKISYQALE